MNSRISLNILRTGAESPQSVTRRSFLIRAVGATLSMGLAACGGESAATKVQAPQADLESTAGIAPTSATAAPEPATTTQAPATPTVAPIETPRPTSVSAAAVKSTPPPSPAAPVVASPTAIKTAPSSSSPTESPDEVDTTAAFLAVESVALPPVDPYIPGDRQSILDRYGVDAARADAVLASGLPVFLATDAIW